MTNAKPTVHYRVLLTLEIEWEEAVEDAAAVVQSDLSPIALDSASGQHAILIFLLYPANAHSAVTDGDHIEKALRSFGAELDARIVLVACQPTFPPLEEDAIVNLANAKLDDVPKRNACRVLEPKDLKAKAETYIRHALRQLGALGVQPSEAKDVEEDYVSLMDYEVPKWRM